MRRGIVLAASGGVVAAVATAAALIISTGLVARPAAGPDFIGTGVAAQGTAPSPDTTETPPPAGAPGAPRTIRTGSAAASLGSIAYLRARYGVSESEAQRRLHLQQQSTAITSLLAQRFPADFGGLWLDQPAGVLRANMIDPAKLAGVVDPAQVKGVKANWSLAQLDKAAGDIAAAVGSGNATTVVDPVGNQLLVRPGGQLSASDPRLSAAIAATQGAARLDTAAGTEQAQLKSCVPLDCPVPPLLSGIRLDIPRVDGSVGGCSAGLLLRSGVSGARYVLTAGHCVLGATHSHVDRTWHHYLGPRYPVSVEDADTRLAENDPSLGRDYAIMRFQDAAAESLWFGLDQQAPYVLSYAGNAKLKFTGFTPLSAIQVGWVVCAAGSGYTPRPGEPFVDSGAGAGYVPGVHCGEITSKGNTINARICARKGDSGGPLFTEADGKVLGILSGGDSRSGACVPGDTETNFYAPISTILDRVNSRTAGAYNFTMTPPPGQPTPPTGGNVTRRP